MTNDDLRRGGWEKTLPTETWRVEEILDESRDISPSLNETLRLDSCRSWKASLTLMGDEVALLEELLEELEDLSMILTLDRLPLERGCSDNLRLECLRLDPLRLKSLRLDTLRLDPLECLR